MIAATDFRNAMSLLTTAVNVVTTNGSTGRHGFTASAVCSVTDTPPTLLVCMNRSARSHQHFIDNKILSVNVLGAQHEHISNTFASQLDSNERFKQGNWTELSTGAPVLTDALVSFDCEIDDIQQVGTHSVFMCRVIAIKYADTQSATAVDAQGKTAGAVEESLAYFNRRYHQVGKPASQTAANEPKAEEPTPSSKQAKTATIA